MYKRQFFGQVIAMFPLYGAPLWRYRRSKAILIFPGLFRRPAVKQDRAVGKLDQQVRRILRVDKKCTFPITGNLIIAQGIGGGGCPIDPSFLWQCVETFHRLYFLGGKRCTIKGCLYRNSSLIYPHGYLLAVQLEQKKSRRKNHNNKNQKRGSRQHLSLIHI